MSSTPRVRCSVFIATSLDGFIARSDGRIDWLSIGRRAGSTPALSPFESIVEAPGEDYGYQRFFDAVDTLVLGRKTYETALGFPEWPYAGKRCVVMTRAGCAAKHGVELAASRAFPSGLVQIEYRVPGAAET